MNVAIIGCGGMGANHAAMAANCGLNIVACADTAPKAAKAMAKTYGAKAYTDWKAVIKDKNVDIVAITTPTPTHKMMVIAAAKAKKHILCEKPFCRTSEECAQAIAAAEKAGVKLFVAHVVRYFQEFDAMKAQVDAGKIGKPGFAKLYRGGIFPVGAGGWFRDLKKSGGVTFDCMIHDLDWIRYVFGEPERIFCQALRRTEDPIMDYSQVTMRMKSGLIATVIGTWAHPSGFQVKAEICGDGGMLEFNSNDSPLLANKRATGAAPGMIVPGQPIDISPYQLEWEDFVGWIKGEGTPRVNAQDALRAVEMVEAALKSADTGKPVTL